MSVEQDPGESGEEHDEGFLHLEAPEENEVAVMAAVLMSTTAPRVRTMVAPPMAPAAAAVAPLTKARSWGLSRWRMNQRPGTTTPR